MALKRLRKKAREIEGMTTKRYRLAISAMHPIQYQAPLWRKLAESPDVDPNVFYVSRHGAESGVDASFGRNISWDIPLLEGYTHESLRPVSIPFVRGPGETRWGPTGGILATGLTRKLRERRYDAILVHGYASGAAWAGTLAAWRTGTRLIVRGDSHDRGRERSFRQTARRRLLRVWMSHVDMVIAIGRLNWEFWRGLGVPEERLIMSRFAIDNERFSETIAADPERSVDLRRRWRVGPAGVVFLFSGKLIPLKQVEKLLEAFATLPKEADVALVVVGTGPLENHLRDIQRQMGVSHVHWEGFVNQREIPHFYKAADVLVLPSRIEMWGLVVNEAMASGTPCIVSDRVGAGPDLVEANGAGMVFPFDDVAALGRCLNASLSPETRGRWRKALVGFSETVSLDRNVEAITEALSIIGRRRTARDGGAEA